MLASTLHVMVSLMFLPMPSLVFVPRHLVLVPSLMLASLVLVPMLTSRLVFLTRHAGQPGARGHMLSSLVFVPKTCWPAWCSCQDARAQTRWVAKTCWAWPALVLGKHVLACWPAWCSCQDIQANMVFVAHPSLVTGSLSSVSLITGPVWGHLPLLVSQRRLLSLITGPIQCQFAHSA